MTIPLKTNPVNPTPFEPEVTQRELKELLEKNLALTEEIHEMTHKIKRYITIQKVLSFIYFLLIVVPLVLSAIYLPPLIKNMVGQYGNLIGMPSGSIDINSLLQGKVPPSQK